MSNVGAQSFTVNAADTAGNTNSSSIAYNVGYGVCVLYDQTRAVRSGATMPIKLQLCNSAGGNVSTPALTVHAVSITRTSDNASEDIEDAGNADPDDNFRYDAAIAGYIFNLKTTGFATGTYALAFSVTGDPVQHVVHFQVR